MNENPPHDGYLYNNIIYYKGLDLICKSHYKSKVGRLYTNYVYTLIDINNKNFTVHEPVDDIKMTFDLKLLSKYFKLPYCSTCHGLQGSSIDEK